MNNSESKLIGAQRLLYTWLGRFEDRSYEKIKECCDYLNTQYNLNLPKPIWGLFWPLVYNGAFEHIGNGHYALTEPVALDYGTHCCHVNNIPIGSHKELAIGLVITESKTHDDNINYIKVSPVSILKFFPPIDKVVDSFSDSLQDVSSLKYYNYKKKQGVAKLEGEGFTRYFSIPSKLYMKEIPDRKTNPDSFAIAYSYGKVINTENNGYYNENKKELRMPAFAMPILIYRVLLLHCLSNKTMPESCGDNYVFHRVPKGLIKELNRIYCNSIAYE